MLLRHQTTHLYGKADMGPGDSPLQAPSPRTTLAPSQLACHTHTLPQLLLRRFADSAHHHVYLTCTLLGLRALVSHPADAVSVIKVLLEAAGLGPKHPWRREQQ